MFPSIHRSSFNPSIVHSSTSSSLWLTIKHKHLFQGKLRWNQTQLPPTVQSFFNQLWGVIISRLIMSWTEAVNRGLIMRFCVHLHRFLYHRMLFFWLETKNQWRNPTCIVCHCSLHISGQALWSSGLHGWVFWISSSHSSLQLIVSSTLCFPSFSTPCPLTPTHIPAN